jgi:mevalonate kinase
MAEKASAVFHNCLVSAPGKVILSGEHAVVYNKTAIATSVDLRCYVLLMVSQSGQVKLDLPDMDLTQTWDVTHITDLLHSTEDQQLQDLKTFCGISEATPSMQELACLILLYLLVNIASDKLCNLPGLDITISSQLPFGAGLGSSAAYSASLSAAMLIACGLIQPPTESHSLDMMDRIPEHFKRMMVAEDLLLTDSGCHGKHCDMSPEELTMINHWAYNCERLVHGTPSGIDNTISIHGIILKDITAL